MEKMNLLERKKLVPLTKVRTTDSRTRLPVELSHPSLRRSPIITNQSLKRTRRKARPGKRMALLAPGWAESSMSQEQPHSGSWGPHLWHFLLASGATLE